MAAQPQVFMNAAEGGTFVGAPAGALTSAVGASACAGGTWRLTDTWMSSEAAHTGLAGSAIPTSAGERWLAPGFGAKIECMLLSTVNWQATLFPGS